MDDGELTGDGRRADRRCRGQDAALLVERARSSGWTRRTCWRSATAPTTSPMIEEAGLGVAYRAKPALAAVADARLDHHGLDALLWAQGIPRAEWVEG